MWLKALAAIVVLFLLAAAAVPRTASAQDQPQPAAAEQGETPFTLVVEGTEAIRWRLGAVISALPDVPYAMLSVYDRITFDRDPQRTRALLLGLAGILAAAAAAEFAFRRLFVPIGVQPDDTRGPSADFAKLALLATAGLIDTLALTVFALVGGLTFLAVQPEEVFTRKAFWAAFLVILGTRMVMILARLGLAPFRSSLRLPRLGDRAARSLYRWLVTLAALIFGCFAFGVLSTAVDLPDQLVTALGFVLHWSLTAALLLFFWQQRRTIGRLLIVTPVVGRRSRAADYFARNAYALLGCLFVGITLISSASRLLTGHSQVTQDLATLALLGILPAVDGLLRMLVHWLVPPPEPTPPPSATSHVAADVPSHVAADVASPVAADVASPVARSGAGGDFAPVIIRNLRIALAVCTVLALDWIWGIDLQRIAAGSLGARIAGSLFEIVITLIIASAVWGVVSTAITRHAPQDGIDALAELEGEGGGAGLTRLQTLLPLFRKFLLVVMVTLVGMIIVSSLGINIGPLLAGAGVVGIAIGFGAQTLVRDIFSGIFFLIDDAFRVGEYIDVGFAKGTVEKISIRSIRLRHHLGQIHTIPFGAIRNVTNFSRDWVIMKLELRLPADTDLEKVRKLVKGVGQELLGHPEFGPQFLQPLKSQGVHRMDDDAFIVRVKFMAKPGEQFVLRREIYRRIQEQFRDNGIHFAPRRVIVDAAGASVDEAHLAAAAVTTVPRPAPRPE